MRHCTVTAPLISRLPFLLLLLFTPLTGSSSPSDSPVLYTLRTTREGGRGASGSTLRLMIRDAQHLPAAVHRFCYERFNEIGGAEGCGRLMAHVCDRFECGAPRFSLEIEQPGAASRTLRLWPGEVVADAVRLFALSHPRLFGRSAQGGAPPAAALGKEEERVRLHLCAQPRVAQSECDCARRAARIVRFTLVLRNLLPRVGGEATSPPVDLVFDSVDEAAGAGAFGTRVCAALDPAGRRCSATDIQSFAERRLEELTAERFTVENDYYGWLRLQPSATASTIRAAFRRESLGCHPDKVRGKEERFTLLARAYTVLTDRVLRRKYDATRRAGSVPHPLLSSNDARVAQAMAALWRMGIRIGGRGHINIHIGG